MKRVKIILVVFLILFLIGGCNKKDYKVSDNVSLSGKISNKSVIINNVSDKKAILELDKPIVIAGVKVNKLALTYDKSFKDDSSVSVEGIIKENNDSDYDLSYFLDVVDVSPDSAILNTFTNNDFQMTIPSNLIKKCSIESIDNGFIVYSKANKDNGGEVFRIVTMNNNEFKAVRDSENRSLEKVNSDLAKTIVVVYPNENQIVSGNEKEYEEIGDAVNQIKGSIRIRK